MDGENRDEWQSWQTVGREAQHRALIKAWGDKKEHWSGSGKHVKDTEIQHAIPKIGEELGYSHASVVDRITFRSIPLARKMIRGSRYRPVSELRKEVDIMERLVHRHIVLLIGSYTSTLKQNRLYLLLYPAATCDLKIFLQDIEDIRRGSSMHIAETAKRFESLGFKEVLPNAQSISQLQSIDASSISWHEPLKYLRSILGCITEAVAYVHGKNVRHLDLKPGNILLTPKRAYLADFGISRNLEDASNSLTEGYAGGTLMYQSPEALEKRIHNMSPAEIYSLGAVFLGIATVLYGENQSQFDSIMKELEPKVKAARITGFLSRLGKTACNDNQTINESQAYDQKPIVDLIGSMLEYQPEKRPTALETSHALVELGGRNQIYHEECCRKSAEQLASLRGSIIKSLQIKRAAQTQELFDVRAKLEELQISGDTRVKALEKERDVKTEELDIVRNAFDSRLETEKTNIASLWIRRLDIEKKEHETSKKELENARARIRKLEEETQKFKARKEKRNHNQFLEPRKGPLGKRDREDGTSTPSRLPVMRNSTSPLVSQKSFDLSKKSTGAKSENDLTTLKLRTPPQHQRNDDSDTDCLMAASGATLVGSISSVSPHSSPPPSPLLSKSVNIAVPKLNGTERNASYNNLISSPSKSYADMLRPTATSMKSMKNGIEKNAAKLSLRGPATLKNKNASLERA